MDNVVDLENCRGRQPGDSSMGMQEGMCGCSCVFDMLILIEMFSASVGTWSGAKLTQGPIAGRRNVCY